MKLLNEDLLKEYGFIEKSHPVNGLTIKVVTRNNVDIAIRKDGFYYSNMGIDYPIRDTAGLRKLYKELRREELKPI